MKLLSVGGAKSIWLFDVNELNPSGKQIFPDALTWLGEKYSFATFPKSVADTNSEKPGLHFNQGRFQADSGGSFTANFSIHEDGVVAETWSSTEIGDEFITDILRSASAKYGLDFRFESILRKVYVSEVTVQFDRDLSVFGKQLNAFCERLDVLMAHNHLPKYELTGMIFSPDTSGTSYKPPGFMLERKTNVPFSRNRYWSKSPFTTRDHLSALEAYEELMTGEAEK
jgi:hypothetical protein